ncbi:hypothetical protein P153DRAFT_303222 [Dothidotthia symphoricarpi CBS 119687]|uniref:Uncharacterized protein n=1 Tax=Dothidotthia symphoricarpi CBS 119687 TaxID=1392245 RepID=A0A6A6A039_9PLEO|nr:uncharacterized protein P153DRAFT_303222 [Dothidotthia symphoricarpi CBS 119687]KAF2124058.1 hypothetical protein P153DRAFT_303222 [Dothidotthia symphoricarpi CBS 119687]
MSNIRTSLPIPTQPWDAAKAKFLDGLSPQEIQRFKDATLENLFYDASSVQKRHAHDSRVWLLQERLSSLTDAIEDYGKALDVYANTYGPVMSPLWGSLRVVLHIVSEAGRFQESVVEMLAQIGDVLPRFRIYETLFKNHERLLVALSTAFLDILQFCVITKDFFARAKRSMIPLSIVLKGAWKSYRRDFETCMIGFRTHTKRVEKEAGLAHMIESARSREIELANRALHIRNGKLQRRHRVLATLPSVDYSTKHLKLSNLRHPGTNNWLCTTPQYLSWFAKATSDCLCCYGIPGSGKSVLSASLVDHIQDVTANDTKSIICYYYCDYLDNASLEPYRLLASIIKQILERLPLDHFDDTFKSPFQEGQTAPTLSRSLAYFLKLLQYFRTVYLVIDGIDELAPNDQVTVLDSIGSILRHPFVIARVYVASRLEEDLIRRTLKPYPTLRLTKDCVRGDIALVIDEQIRSTVTRQNPLLADENLRQEVVNALVSRADDM